MLILRLLFALSGACFVFLLIHSLVYRKLSSSELLRARLDTIRGMDRRAPRTNGLPAMEQRNVRRRLRDIPFFERVVVPAEAYLSDLSNRMTPKEWRDWLQHKIVLAGKTKEIRPQTLFGTMLLSGALIFLMVWYYLRARDTTFLQRVAFLSAGSLFGAAFPMLFINSMIRKRKEEIMRQLPEVLDLLCVSVQAGLSFDAALRKITVRMKGPLIDEFKHFQDDVRMGMIRRNAMKNLASRCDLQDVSLFMTALIQAEKLGSSMGKTLKNQADNIRERRRQYIKAEAMRAPIKILFPLILFIFPAIFVVTLIPALLSLMKNL